MNHLTDEQLNEILDHSIFDDSIIRHLGTCADCQARLEDLRAVFTVLESVPEVQPPRDLTVSILARLPQRRVSRNWTWLSVAQAFASVALMAWFLTFLNFDFIPAVRVPTTASVLSSLFVFLSSISLPKFSLPTVNLQLPTINLQPSTFELIFLVASASLLWLVGNGLLLRTPARRNHK